MAKKKERQAKESHRLWAGGGARNAPPPPPGPRVGYRGEGKNAKAGVRRASF